MKNLDGLAPHEIYDKTLDTVREQFRVAGAKFSTGNMASWLQEVEQMLNRAKADLVEKRPLD
jgi:hypothetical protein